jgi:hypothetical protein
MRKFLLSFVALVLSAACQAAAPSGATLTGSWGGEHVGIELHAGGGTLEYDCATGAIDEPIRLDGSGAFRAHGTHSPGHGGPDHVGEEPPRLPSEYHGRVRGDRMTLNVRVPSSDLTLGPYTLFRGAPPQILRCL